VRDRSPRPGADGHRAVDVEELYRRYRKRLYGLCIARLGDPALAEDVVQDVFADAMTVLPRFECARPVWPLLASMAVRDCIDVHRRRTVAASLQEDLATADAPTASDVTVRAALGRVAHEAMAREIDALPPRQRAALQLAVVDEWTYAEIAERLGCSVGTVSQLVFRARERLRRARARVLAGLGPALRDLGARVQGLLDRLALASPWANGVGGLWARGVEGPAALAFVVVAGLLGLSVPAAEGTGPHPRPASAPASASPEPTSPRGGTPVAPVGGGTGGIPSEPAVQAASLAAQRAAYDFAEPLLPSADSDEQGEQVSSLTVSPGYERDHSVFVTDGGHRLWVTRDGGASWSRVRATGLQGTRLLLPPAYPQDGRIFSLGLTGLQVSSNGGDSFETLVPGAFVDAALPSGFGDGNPTVLLVGQGGALVRYDSRTGVAEPVVFDGGLAGHVVGGIRYDAAEPERMAVRVLSRHAVADGPYHRWYISECVLGPPPAAVGLPTRPACTTSSRLGRFQAAAGGLATSALGADSVFVLGPSGLLASSDGGRTFRARSPGTDAPRAIAVLPGAASASAILAWGSRPALVRTDDGGDSWASLAVDLPGFAEGANAVAVTPTGRIIAGGARGGLACSADDGRTWAPLCPTPDA
jgi:RNA polymerase sigma factor (sigma-70 family)